jgi:UDP-2,4-diacetamido-2,4,6-trideoxy-beta-L-altropyranose hydrolase
MVGPMIVFRTDASLAIGTGHVMRCLTLADALRECGACSHFISRAHDGHLIEHIRARGHQVSALPVTGSASTAATTDNSTAHAHWLGADWVSDARETLMALQGQRADWLVVDHYALDARWEQHLRQACQQLLVIDDLADRPHDCELLLDQNLGRLASDYGRWVPVSCTVLAGPQHALLRPEFADWRLPSMARRSTPRLRHLLITLGGVDKDNATSQLLQALRCCPLPNECKITVVMGPHAPWLCDVLAQAAQMPWPTEVLVDVHNMAELMAQCDLAIGAAGSTNWERCCLGLPCLLMVLADNQRSSALALEQANAVQVLALASLAVSLPAQIRQLASGETLETLSNAAQAITSGDGAPLLAQRMLTTCDSSIAGAQTMAGETC